MEESSTVSHPPRLSSALGRRISSRPGKSPPALGLPSSISDGEDSTPKSSTGSNEEEYERNLAQRVILFLFGLEVTRAKPSGATTSSSGIGGVARRISRSSLLRPQNVPQNFVSAIFITGLLASVKGNKASIAFVVIVMVLGLAAFGLFSLYHKFFK